VRFAVVGDPVEHSRSPAIHNAAFAALGIDAEFGWLQVRRGEFDQVDRALRSGELNGVSVTMPHKHAAYEAADERSENAMRAGAVNTLVVKGDRLMGHNTDVAGVRHALATIESDEAAPILILGSGGAAAAALLAVEARQVHLSDRSEAHACSLADRVGVEVTVVAWKEPVPMATVINATPLGMAGEDLPDGVVERAAALLLPAADGLTMLTGQAVEAFELFTGQKAPATTMEHAAREW